MRKIKIRFNFMRMPVAQKIEFGRNIVNRMTGNSSFTNPDVHLLQITDACNNLETAFIAAQGGGPQQTAALHEARDVIHDLLRKQATYVDRVAAGNETIILSSGFNCTNQRKPDLRPEFIVKNGEKEGEIFLRHKAVKGARSWLWQYCTDPLGSSEWIFGGLSTKARFVISDLKPGIKYWFRVCFVTPSGQSAFCDPIAKYAV